jgi:hypothetical protein
MVGAVGTMIRVVIMREGDASEGMIWVGMLARAVDGCFVEGLWKGLEAVYEKMGVVKEVMKEKVGEVGFLYMIWSIMLGLYLFSKSLSCFFPLFKLPHLLTQHLLLLLFDLLYLPSLHLLLSTFPLPLTTSSLSSLPALLLLSLPSLTRPLLYLPPLLLVLSNSLLFPLGLTYLTLNLLLDRDFILPLLCCVVGQVPGSGELVVIGAGLWVGLR